MTFFTDSLTFRFLEVNLSFRSDLSLAYTLIGHCFYTLKKKVGEINLTNKRRKLEQKRPKIENKHCLYKHSESPETSAHIDSHTVLYTRMIKRFDQIFLDYFFS